MKDLNQYIQDQIAEIKSTVGDEKVMLALSGGVDSSVCAALLAKAIPGQLTCVFVDHGLMRKDEGNKIEAMFKDFDMHLVRVNAAQRFVGKLQGVLDPEEKRKIIGREFIAVFEEEAKKNGHIKVLAQGTIYADIVESGKNGSANIKSHHNVGGLPENLDFTTLVEPLSGLYKDEVRAVGTLLGLPDALVQRPPFPGPGLGVRIMGEITFDKIAVLQNADAIVQAHLDKLSPRPSQYFAVMTDTYSVGIKDGQRTYDPVIAIRAVTTTDFMTAHCTNIPFDTLQAIATEITDNIKEVSRVVYDLSNKPTGTIEWL